MTKMPTLVVEKDAISLTCEPVKAFFADIGAFSCICPALICFVYLLREQGSVLNKDANPGP